jgi:hypothetical protein
MGAKQHNDRKHAASELGALQVPSGTLLTDPISVGRSGREWHLHLQARRTIPNRDCPSGIEIKRFFSDESTVVRQTCQFLRQHAPELYKEIHSHLQHLRPVDPNTPWSEDGITKRRLARLRIEPLLEEERGATKMLKEPQDEGRKAPFTCRMPEIGEGHWAIPVHHNPGNYMTTKSGDRKEMSDEELQSDMEAIKNYLREYKKLAKEVSGRNVWRATYDPSFRDPYYTCMEICIGEARIPSHFLALVHYGIGLHFMYEQTLEWEKRENPKSVSPNLIDALKESFRTLARLYREDFCL